MFRTAAALALFVGIAVPAEAAIEDVLIEQLHRQGYSEIVVGRTWLGRIVISATMGGVRREILVKPSTGEILSDSAVIQADRGAGGDAVMGTASPGQTTAGGTLIDTGAAVQALGAAESSN